MNTTQPATSTLRRALGIAVASGLLAVSASAQTIVDNFDGTTVDAATWYGFQSSGSLPAVSDGTLTLDAGGIGNSNRSVIISQATNINPFEQAVTLTFSGLALDGVLDSTQTAWGNTFYAAVGRASVDLGGSIDGTVAPSYLVVGGTSANTYDGALGLNIRRSASAITLSVYDRSGTLVTTNHTLAAIPTDVVWTIDGTGPTKTWTVNLTYGGEIESDSFSGNFSLFNLADLDNGSGTYVSRAVVGAYNLGPLGELGEATVVTLDGVSISAIPEPTTYALLASAFIGGVVIFRRRRQVRR